MPDEAPLLSHSGFDRATHHRTDPEWLAEAWTRAQVLLLSSKSSTPVTADQRHLALRSSADVGEGMPRRFLGIAQDVVYFTVTVEPEDDTWLTLRDLAAQIGDLQAGLYTSAVALEQWHRRHTHCPRCGALTSESNGGWTRTCPQDGTEHFPRTDPAVIMLVHDGVDGALLGRGAKWPEGRFSTLAGFVEPGESLEAAVAREVFEEVGVHICDIHYVASQPWPFPSSLMLGFSALVDGNPDITIDPVEMAEAAWFSRAQVQKAADWVDAGQEPDPDARLQFISPKLSISRFLIDAWLAGRLP